MKHLFALLLALVAVPLAAQQAINITAASDPFEIKVGVVENLKFNVCVTEENEVVKLKEDTTAIIEVQGINDADTGLVLLPFSAEWSFFQGFKAGKRALSLAIIGCVPDAGTVVETVAVISFPNQEPLEVPIKFQVRGGSDGIDTYSQMEFCIHPGKGETLPGSIGAVGPTAKMLPDFKNLLSIGAFTFKDAPTATIVASTEFEIVEILEDNSEIPTDMTLKKHIHTVDPDDDGWADAVHFTAKIKSLKLELAFGTERLFELRAL